MVFARDVELGLQVAVLLANSAEPPDTLETVDDLETVFSDFGYTGRHDGDEAELHAVRGVRAELRGLLTADRDGAVAAVNDVLLRHQAVPQLARHDGLDWHLHAVATDAPLAERILVDTAMAMMDVVRADEMSRLGLCADDDCESVVLDLSRNRSRRFCSTTCGNRNAVAAYRARQASAD